MKKILLFLPVLFLFACATSDEVKAQQARDLYTTGLKAYNYEEYKEAEKSWKKAYELDPSNEQVERALKRLEQKKEETKLYKK